VISTGGSLNRYPAGATVSLDRISGHRDGDATACPGDGLYAQLPQLRQMVIPGPALGITAVKLRSSSVRIDYGTKAKVDATLTGPGSAPLMGQPVDAQLLGRFGAWKTLASLTTDSAGTVSTRLRFSFNHALRMRFAGGPGLLPAQSKPVTVSVRPKLTARLASPGTTMIRRGGRAMVRMRVPPNKRVALLLADRVARNGSKRRVARKIVRLRSGKGRSSLIFQRRGSYTLSLVVLADLKNAGARSAPISLQVR